MSEQSLQDEMEPPTSFEDVYGVNTELVRAVEAALEEGPRANVCALLKPLRPADIADLVVVLGREDRRRPIGQVALNRLMRTRRPVLLSDIMEAEATSIPVDMDQE